MTTTPPTTASEAEQLAQTQATIAEALHEAWLKIHLARLDENHQLRPIGAYQETAKAKNALSNAWKSLDLPGAIHDAPAPAGG